MSSQSSNSSSGGARTPPPASGASPLWRVERIFSDGRRELVTLAGEPWEFTETQARQRASVMQAEETDVTVLPLQASVAVAASPY